MSLNTIQSVRPYLGSPWTIWDQIAEGPLQTCAFWSPLPLAKGKCSNSNKQRGAALRIWAGQHNSTMHFMRFQSMSQRGFNIREMKIANAPLPTNISVQMFFLLDSKMCHPLLPSICSLCRPVASLHLFLIWDKSLRITNPAEACEAISPVPEEYTETSCLENHPPCDKPPLPVQQAFSRHSTASEAKRPA